MPPTLTRHSLTLPPDIPHLSPYPIVVAVRSAKEVRDDIPSVTGGVLGRQADDVEAVEKREDVRRDDLEAEHSHEGGPEELETFGVRLGVKVER